MTKPQRTFLLALLLLSLSVALIPTLQAATLYETAVDPLGSFEGPGPSAPLYWTGLGQRINNPSFETGTFIYWAQSHANNVTGSGALIVSPGEDGTWGARLTVQSGNATAESRISLAQSLEQIGFGTSIRLKASIHVDQVAGTGQSDRVEVSVTLSTSTGQTRTIHYYYGGSPANGTSDAYIAIGGIVGQWVIIDRDVVADALARFTDFAALNAVREVRASVFSRTIGVDPKIMFRTSDSNFVWNSTEAVVYDTDGDRRYDPPSEPVILGPAPGNQDILQDDPKMKFVDSNTNGVWDTGEPIIYDSDNDNVYETGEPVITGSPTDGTAFYRTSTSQFDRLELYTANVNFEWLVNTGFEGVVLTGWGSYGVPVPFQPVTSRALSGAYSARGMITGGAADMSQSFDAKPTVELGSTFRASSFITDMTGNGPGSYVDVWLGLVDNSTTGNLAYVHYLFMTGDGALPANSTSAVYHRVNGFGTFNRWLNVTGNLQQEISYFDTLRYSLPFHVIAVVVEVSAQTSSTTTAYFDSFSLSGSISGTASSYRYAVDGGNSTYVYTTPVVPQGGFYILTPGGQSVLNITGPGGVLPQGDYTTNSLTGRIDIPDSTSFSHPSGSWRFITTSFNAVSTVYVEDPVTKTQLNITDPGAIVNLVSRSLNPFGAPLSSATVYLTLWTTSGVQTGASYSGTSNGQGWFNVSGITLQTAGVLRLQAIVSGSHAGLRTFQVSALYAASITVSLSTNQIEAGSAVTISGSISPQRQGVNLTILYRPAGVSDWTFLASVQTGVLGGFSYTWRPSEGLYEVRVSATDQYTQSADSIRAQLTVIPSNPLDEIILYAAVGAVAAGAVVATLFFRKRRTQRQATHVPGAS